MSVPEACLKSDLNELVDLANRVFRGSGGGDMGAEYPLVFSEANLPYCRVIKEDGRIVSHVGVSVREASILGCSLRVASIGAVATDAAYRGRGHASLLMEDARRLALDEGCVLMLISGGRGMYHRLGYVTVGAYPSFRIGADRLPTLPAGVRVAPCGESEIPALCALYQRNPVRYFRPVDDWAKLLAAGMLMNHAADCLGVWEEGRLVAYAATQRSQPDAQGQPSPARVMEHAGSETALFAALSAVAAHSGATQVNVVPQPGTVDLARLLRAAGAEEREAAFGGTLGILDAEAFFVRIRRCMHERLGSLVERLEVAPLPAGGVRFTLGEESYEVDTMGRLTALVFGGSTAEACDVPTAVGEIGAVLARLFPMPLLWYGYNYV